MSEIEPLSRVATIIQLSYGEYLTLRAKYETAIADAMQGYLSDPTAKVTKFRNAFKLAMVNAFLPAYEIGYADGGGGDYLENATKDDRAWLAAKQQAELGYIDSLFTQLKELRSEGPEAWTGEPDRRAAGYGRTLDGIYNEGKLRGSADIMLEFGGEDGQESCPECQKWKGKRHRVSFWKKRGLIPGQPGNPAFSCHGYNCKHYLFDPVTGNLYTF